MIFCVFKEKEKNNAFQGTEIAVAADGNMPFNVSSRYFKF